MNLDIWKFNLRLGITHPRPTQLLTFSLKVNLAACDPQVLTEVALDLLRNILLNYFHSLVHLLFLFSFTSLSFSSLIIGVSPFPSTSLDL